MKKWFNPFSGESLLLALGLTLASYLIVPLIKELVLASMKNNKGLYNNANEEKFVIDKEQLT